MMKLIKWKFFQRNSQENVNKEKYKNSEEFLKKWDYNILFSLIILLVLATIIDLGVSFEKILEIILH